MPRVLIVEDDLTILGNLSQLLQLSGLDVMEAHDGLEALRLLNRCAEEGTGMPRIIVSDLMMPNMDGFELLSAIRAVDQLKKIPFVLLSARSDDSDLQHAFALGANDYLIKPFEVDDLIETVRYHLTALPSQPMIVPEKGCSTGADFFLE